MKKFVTVTQISAWKFDVEFVDAVSKYEVKTKGLLIAIFESSAHNDKFCFELAEGFNKATPQQPAKFTECGILDCPVCGKEHQAFVQDIDSLLN